MSTTRWPQDPSVETVAPPVVPKRAPNLLASSVIRRLLLSRSMPLTFQVLALLLFAWVLYDGFFGAPSSTENFATLGVWFLFFWPVILISLVFLGRAWCAVCPLGTLTAAVGRFSRGWPSPKRLSNTGLSLFFFLTILWVLRPILGLSASPMFTAWFFVAWTIVALVVGFLYASRAFCRFVCPLAAPLSLMARVAPVELRAAIGGRLNSLCRRCAGHECYQGSTTVQGCPMGEYPAAMTSNANCIFCLKCLKSCPFPASLQVRLRWPFSELWRVKRPLVVDALASLALMSIFLWHMALGHEPRIPHLFHLWAEDLHRLVPQMGRGDVEYLLVLACGLAALGSLFSAATFISARLAGLSFRKAFALSGYPYVALVTLRALGYMTGDILTKGGDLVNYLASFVGVYLYSPSALVEGPFRPLFTNTGYHVYAVLLTVPLLLALPLTWFIAYRTVRNLGLTPKRSLLVAAPHMLLATALVTLYEFAYLVGYRVIT